MQALEGIMKGQLKIQEMAFVLVALVIFFALVALGYLALRLSGLEKTASSLQEEQASALVKNIAALPEFTWAGCRGCIDMDKAVLILEQNWSKEFLRDRLELDLLFIERIYPIREKADCSLANYPRCNKIMLLNSSLYGRASESFVALCAWDADLHAEQCELGRIIASGKGVKNG